MLSPGRWLRSPRSNHWIPALPMLVVVVGDGLCRLRRGPHVARETIFDLLTENRALAEAAAKKRTAAQRGCPSSTGQQTARRRGAAHRRARSAGSGSGPSRVEGPGEGQGTASERRSDPQALSCWPKQRTAGVARLRSQRRRSPLPRESRRQAQSDGGGEQVDLSRSQSGRARIHRVPVREARRCGCACARPPRIRSAAIGVDTPDAHVTGQPEPPVAAGHL